MIESTFKLWTFTFVWRFVIFVHCLDNFLLLLTIERLIFKSGIRLNFFLFFLGNWELWEPNYWISRSRDHSFCFRCPFLDVLTKNQFFFLFRVISGFLFWVFEHNTQSQCIAFENSKSYSKLNFSSSLKVTRFPILVRLEYHFFTLFC